MTRRFFLLGALVSVLALSAGAQERKDDRAAPAPAVPKAKPPDLRFKEDEKDLVVSLWIEGPAARQVVLTDYTVYDGKPAWDEPPIGVDRPRRPPRVELRYLVLVNRNLPGFVEGLMSVPTPPEVRREQRQEVIWRLPNLRAWGFRKEDATFSVQGSSFEATSEQLRQALPRIKQTIDVSEEKTKGGSAAP